MTPPPSQRPILADLAAPIWRAFRFETGTFLLHVPSSHVLSVPEEVHAHVSGEKPDPEVAAYLDELASELPTPPPRPVPKPEIHAISLNMAQGCNLRCTYCFAGEGDYGKKGMMTAETAKKAIAYFTKGRRWFHVKFFGGEPMLNFKVIKEVVEWCETLACDVSFSMTTNGTLLTEDKLAWLEEKKVSLILSYDGKGLQAKQRLNKDKVTNSEALVERKINAFQEQLGVLRSLVLRSTVSRENLDLVEEAIMGTLTSQNFKLAVARHSTDLENLSFRPEDVRKLGEIYRKVVDRLLAAKDYERVLNFENIRKHVDAIHNGKTHKMTCGAGLNYLTVSTDGRFYLCHRFNGDEDECFGTVDSGVNEARLEEIAHFRAAKTEPCASCWMREWCAGGCFHNHKAATGDKFSLDPLFCRLQEVEIEQALRVYTHLLTEAPHLLETRR